MAIVHAEVGLGPVVVFIYFIKSRLFPEAGRGGVSVEEGVVVGEGGPSSNFQLIFGEVEDGDEFVVLHFRLAADVSVLGIEDGLAVSPVCHSVVDDQAQHSHFGIVPAADDEVCSNDLGHRPLSLPAIFEDALAEGGFIRSGVSENSMLGEVPGVVPGGEIESIVEFEGREDCLFL